MQTQPNSVRTFLLGNLIWMAGSVGLAIVIWFAAVNQQNPIEQQRFPNTIPVQVLQDADLLVVNPPTPVQVIVRAPRSVWDVLQSNDITVTADLRGKSAGTYTVALNAALSPARQGAASEVLPSQVTITLAKRSEQAFNITVQQTQTPPVGFIVNKQTASVPTATVSGSDDAVKRVSAVVARVSLASQDKPLTRTLDLLAVDTNNDVVSGVTLDPEQVTVTFDIQPRPGVRVLSVAPILRENTLEQGYLLRSYTANPSSIAVQGDPSSIEALNGTIGTEPIDLTGKTAPFTQTVKLALPDGVTLTDPVDIVISVQIDPITATREFPNVPIQTQGLDPTEFAIAMQPDHVTVIVTGPQAALDTLQASDITVIAPLNGLGGGVNTVVLQASVAHAGLTNTDLNLPNRQIQVTIRALHPTPTLTPSLTPPPTLTPTPAATGSATP